MKLETLLNNPDLYATIDKDDLRFKSFDPLYSIDTKSAPFNECYNEYFLKFDIYQYKGNISLSIENSCLQIFFKDSLIHSCVFLQPDNPLSMIRLQLMFPLLITSMSNPSFQSVAFQQKITHSNLILEVKEFAKYFMLDMERSKTWLFKTDIKSCG